MPFSWATSAESPGLLVLMPTIDALRASNRAWFSPSSPSWFRAKGHLCPLLNTNTAGPA